MKEFSTPHCGRTELQLVAFDEIYAYYAEPPDCDYLTTVRRDGKKITKRDKRRADAQIKFLLMAPHCELRDC